MIENRTPDSGSSFSVIAGILSSPTESSLVALDATRSMLTMVTAGCINNAAVLVFGIWMRLTVFASSALRLMSSGTNMTFEGFLLNTLYGKKKVPIHGITVVIDVTSTLSSKGFKHFANGSRRLGLCVRTETGSAAGVGTVLVVDYIQTLPSELHYLWTAPWSPIKVLYILARYSAFISAAIIIR
ncbi:hypothetical protein FA15DRAFT_662047, partial [Coprinopsis marcescibilis]